MLKFIVIGSGMVALHISRYLVDKRHEVRCFGTGDKKEWINKNYLVRDLEGFRYKQALPTAEDIEWADSVVYVGDDEGDKIKEFAQVCQIVNEKKRLILISSDQVYLETEDDPADESWFIDSEKIQAKKNEQAWINYNQEQYLKLATNWTILRPAQLYGDGIFNRIHELIFPALLGEKIIVGDHKRDFCYIYNLSEVVELVAQKEEAKGEIFNVANGHPVRYAGLANTISVIVGTTERNEGKVSSKPNSEVIVDSKKPEENIVVSIKKIYDVLKYEPTYNNHLTAIHKMCLPFEIRFMIDVSAQQKIDLMNRL